MGKDNTMQKIQEETPIAQPKLTLLPLLLDMEQAMVVLALGKSKIYELVETEGLPMMRLGKSIRFSYKALEQWIDERMQQDVA